MFSLYSFFFIFVIIVSLVLVILMRKLMINNKVEESILKIGYKLIKASDYPKGLIPGLKRGFNRIDITDNIEQGDKKIKVFIQFNDGENPLLDPKQNQVFSIFLRRNNIKWKDK